jgi:hypothetical protein
MKATERSSTVDGERERELFLCVVIYNVKCPIVLCFWLSGMGIQNIMGETK